RSSLILRRMVTSRASLAEAPDIHPDHRSWYNSLQRQNEYRLMLTLGTACYDYAHSRDSDVGGVLSGPRVLGCACARPRRPGQAQWKEISRCVTTNLP